MPKFTFRFQAMQRDPNDPEYGTIGDWIKACEFDREIEAPNEKQARQEASRICRELSDSEKRFFADPWPQRMIRLR